jgi:glycosyltransferase involved in cell wall biosynthesis
MYEKEIIIVEDFSPDNTEEVVSKIIKENKDMDIKYFRLERNMGGVAARNAG